jgi:hypothetical protein
VCGLLGVSDNQQRKEQMITVQSDMGISLSFASQAELICSLVRERANVTRVYRRDDRIIAFDVRQGRKGFESTFVVLY